MDFTEANAVVAIRAEPMSVILTTEEGATFGSDVRFVPADPSGYARRMSANGTSAAMTRKY
jgi:hypothetical protein